MIYLCLSTLLNFGFQTGTIDFEQLKFEDHLIFAEKTEVLNRYGQPNSIVYPKYECGFHEDGQPGGPYYQLIYDDFIFIGSDKERFMLESLRFDSDGRLEIRYGQYKLNGQTTKKEFGNIMGNYVRQHFQNPDYDAIILFFENSDDGARFTFRNGRLTDFEYWSPC